IKGIVFKYGAQGDPLVRPKFGGKIVVLTGYAKRPEIGTEVDYNLNRQGESVVYGTIQLTSQKSKVESKAEPRVQENLLESSLNEIQALWDRSFAEHMRDEAKVSFLQSLREIRKEYQRGDYEGAAQIAHKNYLWAIHESDFCELTGPGFEYFPMFKAFESLERLIRKSCVN